MELLVAGETIVPVIAMVIALRTTVCPAIAKNVFKVI
jgi:hypothetical protein